MLRSGDWTGATHPHPCGRHVNLAGCFFVLFCFFKHTLLTSAGAQLSPCRGQCLVFCFASEFGDGGQRGTQPGGRFWAWAVSGRGDAEPWACLLASEDLGCALQSPRLVAGVPAARAAVRSWVVCAACTAVSGLGRQPRGATAAVAEGLFSVVDTWLPPTWGALPCACSPPGHKPGAELLGQLVAVQPSRGPPTSSPRLWASPARSAWKAMSRAGSTGPGTGHRPAV